MMIAVEEQCFKSVKTDASLYNGRPTGTGTQCHSVGVTSSTLSIPKDKDVVSVENVHSHSKQWFVLRMSYGRVARIAGQQRMVGKLFGGCWVARCIC